MASPDISGEMNIVRYGDFGRGSFRTITDGPAPKRAPVRALPQDPPTHFHAGVKDADLVHIVGPRQEDQAKAITYGLYPEVAAGKIVWTADLTGHRVTEDLTRHAVHNPNNRVGASVWTDISPTRLVESHREIGLAHAAKLVVASMPPEQQADDALFQTRIIHLTRIFERLAEGVTHGEKKLSLLGGGYNAIGSVLLTGQRFDDFKLDEEQATAMLKLYTTARAKDRAQEVLGPVHDHMEALLREDNFTNPQRFHRDLPQTLSHFAVKDRGVFVDARRRMLATHLDLRSSEDDANDAHSGDARPEEIAMAGVEHVDPAPLLHIQENNQEHGARTLYVFGDVNETTEAVIGTDLAVTGSLGGLTGPQAESMADRVGKNWTKAVTSVTTHGGGSLSSGGGGRSQQIGSDKTTTFEARHAMSSGAAQHVAPDSVTIVQGTVIHKDVPFVPAHVQARAMEATSDRAKVRALPTRKPSLTGRVVRSIRRGSSDKK